MKYYNGKMYKESEGFKSFTNAHLNYKDRSVIVDYEHCLHSYELTQIPEDAVPVEIYPYREDIALMYIKLDPRWKKVDIIELVKELERLLEKENK